VCGKHIRACIWPSRATRFSPTTDDGTDAGASATVCIPQQIRNWSDIPLNLKEKQSQTKTTCYM
jgi:hypothetical protein